MKIALGWAIALFLTFLSSSGRAETIAAPVGGRFVPLGERVGCPESLAGTGWSLDPDGKSVKPPAKDDAIGQIASLRLAPCTGTATLALVAIGPKPAAESAVLDVDAGKITVRGKRLKNAVLAWTAPRPGSDVCVAPDPGESCSFAVARDVSTDPSSSSLTLLPAGLRTAEDLAIYDASARKMALDEFAVRPTQVILTRLLAPESAVDVSSGTGRIALLHPEAVAAVDCADATCDVANGDLVVRGEHGSDEKLDVHVQLRPRVVMRSGTTSDAAPVISVPLQRCPVSLASPPPWSGAVDQRIVLRVGVACTRGDADLEYATDATKLPVERSEVVGPDHFVVLRVGRIDSDTTLRIRRRGTIVGVVPLVPRRSNGLHAIIELPPFGVIDFVPTNRWAKLTLPPAPAPGELVPVAVEGAYEVRRGADGTFIRGAEGAAGAVLLRFGYVDKELPPAFRELTLGELTEPSDRALKVANVPLPVGVLARSTAPLIEVQCGDGDGHIQRMVPQKASYVPYRARDTCQLVIHQEALDPEDGAQAFQISVQVSASDGAPRSEATLSRRLVLRKSDKPTYLAIAGAIAPFDHILVRAGLAEDETHYAVSPSEKGAAQVQWSIVTGTDHIRIYGTAAIPTGLFRIADKGHSGILTLSVGAILRAVWLSREGTEFPVGLEAGVMWLGVAGDTDPAASSRGAVALVAGPGISVPIANVNRVTQTSISLHAWFEYEVSRTILNQSGQAFGFVFGPSISIGDVGTNL